MKWFFSIYFLAAAILLPLAAAIPDEEAPTVEVKIYTPDSSVRFAAADLASIAPAERPYIRYLSLYNFPKGMRQGIKELIRKQVAETVSFTVNSLGTRRKVYIPLFVGDSEETVIRLNIRDYEWKAKDWDDLARNGSGPKPQPDPYFHAFIDEITYNKSRAYSNPGQYTSFIDGLKKYSFRAQNAEKEVLKTKRIFTGRYNQWGQPLYTEQKVKESSGGSLSVPKRIFLGAPWVDYSSYAFLVKETQAESPILRADWFIYNALLPPAYYNFLRLGNRIEDFERLVFADEKLAEKARSQDKAVVVTSMVARNNRTLLRSPTFTKGYYWESHDTLNSVDDRQYINNLLREKFDATEDIGTLPNGLQAYFLTDGKGKRLDVADPNIAIDNTAVDRQVRTGRSCIICHAEGIKPISDEVRTLNKKLQSLEQVKLLVTDKKDAYKIEDLFSSNLDKQILADQNLYSEAIASVNGLSMQANASQYATIYNNYYEVLMTKLEAARDLGVSMEDFERYIRMSNDPVVLALVRSPIGPLRRDQWERSYQSIQLIIMAFKKGMIPAPNQQSLIK